MPEESNIVNLPFAVPDLVGKYQSSAFVNDIPKEEDLGSSMRDFLAKGNTGTDFSVIPTKDIPFGGRYPVYFPGEDNEQKYALAQTGWQKAYNGVAKMSGMAAATFLNGTAGLVYGATKSLEEGRFASLWDNKLSNSLNDWTNSLEDSYAHYKTQRERDGSWWEPSNLFTGNFLWDGIVKNLGFSLGAMAGGFAWGGALKALGITGKLMSTGTEMASQADKIISEATLLPQAERLASINSKLTSAWTKTQGVIGQGLLKSDQAIVATFGSIGEAGMEAINNARQYRETAIANFKTERGYDPTVEDMKAINSYAEKVGNWSLGTNVALLTVTNYIQLPKIYSSSFKGEKNLLNNIIEKEGQYVSSLPEKGFGKLLYKTAKVGSLFFNTAEAFEEGSQYAIQTGTQNYFGKRNKGQTPSELDDGILYGIKEALTTDEGTLNIFLGGFSGALQSSGIMGVKGGRPVIGQTGKIGQRGVTGYGGEESITREEAIKTLNSTKIKDKIKEAYLDVKAAEITQQDRESAIRRGDVLESKDLEFDYAHNFISSRLKYGAKEAIDQEINSLKQEAISDAGFTKLQQEGYAPDTDTKETFLTRLNNLQEHANTAKDLYDSLNLKYKGIINDKKERVYDDLIIDKLVYAASKITDYDMRIPQLNYSLASAGINTPDILQSILIDGVPKVEAIQEAKEQISALNSTNEDELLRDLEDLTELSLRRKQFIEEYNDIKKTPSKYQEQKLTSEQEQTIKESIAKKEVIKIITKTGEKDLEIGIDYFIGKSVDYTKEGLEVPIPIHQITILGENEDGTIKIKEFNGQIKDISKDTLLDYKLSTVESLKTNKTANYFYNHRNDVFEYNFGKDFGGKKSGRLLYEDGKLFFVYKNAKDKLTRKQLFNSQFVAQEGYDSARITKVGEVESDIQRLAREEFTSKEEIKKQKETLVKNRQARRDIINEIEKDTRESLESVNKKLQDRKNDLQNIQDDFKSIEDLKTKGAKKTVGKFSKVLITSVKAINKLSKAKIEVEKEISTLTKEQEDLKMDLSYFQDFSQNLDELPENTGEFLNELKDQIGWIDELAKQTGKSISELNDLSLEIQSTLKDIMKLLKGSLHKQNSEYPDFIKITIDGIIAGDLSLLSQLKEYLADYTIAEDVQKEITINEEQLADVNERLRHLKDWYKEIEDEYRAKQTVLDKFQAIFDAYLKQKEEETKLQNNEQLRKEFENSHDTDVQSDFEERHYELNPKKSNEGVVNSTITNNKNTPYQERTDRFGFRWSKFSDKQRKSYKWVDVTQNTEDEVGLPGLIAHLLTGVEGYNPKEVVVAVFVNNKGQLIDEFGNSLEGENLLNPLQSALYQVRPLPEINKEGHPELKAKYPGEKNKQTSFRDDTPIDIRKVLENQYAERRKQILTQTKLGKRYDFHPSFGTPEYVMKIAKKANGEDQLDNDGNLVYVNDYDARTPVEETGLVSPDMLGRTQVIKVNTTLSNKDSLTEGTVTFKLFAGAVVLKIPNVGLAKLVNRKFTDKEANTIFDVLLQITKNAQEEGSVKKGTKSDRLFNWLKTTVYWGIAKDFTTKEQKKAGYNNIWFETVVKDGQSVSRLKIGKDTQNFVFTPTGLEESKSVIISLIKELYNNTNATSVNKPTSVKYSELIGIDENGEPIMKEWANYQTYLLSNKNPDNSPRKNEEIPLVSRFRPLKGEDDFNRKNIYFTLDNTVDDYISYQTPVEEKKEEVSKEEPVVKETPVYKLDGSENTIPIGQFGNAIFKLDGEKYNATNGKEGFSITVPPETINAFMVAKNVSKEKAGQVIADSVITKFQSELTAMKIPIEPAIETVIEKVVENIPSDVEAKKVDIERRRQEELIQRQSRFDKDWQPEVDEDIRRHGEIGPNSRGQQRVLVLDLTDINTKYDTELITLTGIKPEENKESSFRNRERGKKPSNPEFEARLTKTINQFEGENWTKLEAFLKTSFPNIPVYRVKNIIQATNGKQAWGILQDGAIYIYENAELGTGYHEVFEGVWKMFAGSKEKSLIINEFRNRQGSYQDRFTGETIKYSETTDAQLKEEIAEEFRDFQLTGKLVERNQNKSLISKLFHDLVNFITHFFTGKDAINNTQKLFNKIGNGYYAQFNPYESNLNYASAGIIDVDNIFAGATAEFSRVKNIPYVPLHDVIQQMTYSTLTELTLNNKSLFTISEAFKTKKNELYTRLKEEVLGYVGAMGDSIEDGITKGKYTSEQASKEYNNIETLYNSIETQWKDIVKKHQEHLASSDIKFDENDDIILTDEENSGKGDYQAANKIDSFRKAHAAIKLLFGTVARTNASGTSWEPSTIGGVKLMAADQVHIQLLNQLHDAVGPDEMFVKFNDFALKNPNYVALYKRITKIAPAEGQQFDFSGLATHDIQLIGAFWAAMKKQNADVVSVYITADGEVQIADSALNSAARQSKRSLLNTLIDVIKNEKTPYFSYDKKTGKYTVTKALENYELSDIPSYISFLSKLGIDFKLEDINHLTRNQRDKFKESIAGIKTSFSKMKPLLNKEGKVVLDDKGKPIDHSLITLSDKTFDSSANLLKLGAIQAIIEHPDFESTYFNVNGERTQTYIGTNTGSDLYDVFKGITNIDGLKDTKYKHLLTDVFTSKREGDKIISSSVVLQKVFDLSSTGIGDRRENTEEILHTQVINGLINEQTGKKKESSRQDYRQRLIQTLNLNSDGIYLTLVPGDASMEWGTRLHDGNDPFVSEEDFLEKRYVEIFKNYFISEVELSRDDRHVVKGKNSKDLRFFKDILGDTLNNKVRDSKQSPEKIYEDNKAEINNAVKSFIENEGKSKEDLLRTYGIIEGSGENISVENLLFAQKEQLTQKTLETKLQVLAVNYIIANIEFHKLIYSDPYQYSQELKRVKSFSSPAQPIIHSSHSFSEALNNSYNEGFEEGDIGWTDFRREYFRSVTLGDVLSANDLVGYETPWEETDGGALITLKANRIFGLRAGSWTEDNERQFLYDIAYQKTVQGLPLSQREKDFEIHKITTKEGKVKYIGKNPNVKSTYTPRKPIVRGNKENDREYNDLVLDKIAMVVHSFRILHELDPNSNAVKFYNKNEREDVDYAVYNSGRKVGAEVVHELYTKGKFNETPYETQEQRDNVNSLQGIINVPFSIVAVQSEVPSKEGHQVIQGSQITKDATMDFMESGVPIDEELGKEIQHNQEILEAKQLHGYQTLLKRLGIEKVEKGFKINDVGKLIGTLKDEFLKRETNDNVLDALEGFEDGKVVLEATPIYKQIRNILYSIADKNVIRPTISGGQKVQISSALLEENRIQREILPNGTSVYTSDILKFYEDEDGKRVCEIMVERWFNSPLSDDELLKYLNDTPEGQKILGGIGFRIPTQNKNSIDVFKIAKFLPKGFGDSVVVPSALVRKVGSDFDVDKLFVYLKNVYKDNKGNIKSIPFLGIGEEAKTKFGEMFDKGEFLSKKQFQEIQEELTLEGSPEDKFIKAIFGSLADATEEDYIREYVEDTAEVGERERVIDLMYKKSLENEYIESLERITSHPLNFAQLTRPNSAKELKELTKKVNAELGRKEIDYSSPGNMLSWAFMSNLRHSFVTGKQIIGIAAVGQAAHAQWQRTLVYNNTDNISEEDKKWLGDGEIKFQEYNSVIIQGKKRAVVSKIKSANGKDFISNNNSAIIDGAVDVSNGTWLIELGFTPNVVATGMLLLKYGVSKESVAYFLNQPIVKDYLRNLEAKGYSWLFNDKLFADMQDIYEPQPNYFAPENYKGELTEIPSEEELFKMLKHNQLGRKSSDINDLQRAQQQFILKEFLKYAYMARQMFTVTQASNYDTANLNDPYLIFQKQEQLKKAQSTIFSSQDKEGNVIPAVDAILNSSFVGSLKNLIFNIRDAFSEVLISDKTNTRNVMENVLRPYTDLPSKDFVKISQKAVNDMFDWAMQNSTRVNNRVAEILLGNDTQQSAAEEIIDYKNKVLQDPKHPLFNNLILNSIKQQGGDRVGKVNNLYITGRDNKVYDQNLIIYGFEELKKILKDENKDLYGKLVRLAVLQSGLTTSPISFTSLLPYNDFVGIYNETLSSLESMTNLSNFNTLNVFERNNWNNENVTSFVRANMKPIPEYYTGMIEYKDVNTFLDPKRKLQRAINDGIIPKLVGLNPYEARENFIVYSWEGNISKQKRILARKTGDRSHIHKALMKRVLNPNGTPMILTNIDKKTGKVYTKYIYKAINAWGDSFRAQELYDKLDPANPLSTLGQQSVLDNGFDKYTEVEDYVITEILEGEKEITANAPINIIQSKLTPQEMKELLNMNTPEGLPPIARTSKTC